MKKRKKKKTPTEIAKAELYILSHTFIRNRDSVNPHEIGGQCFDCGHLCFGQNFQAGHFIADSKGAITRYHPANIHGQFSGCNMKVQQEHVKINYTLKMEDKYGRDYVMKLKQMSEKSIKADIIFYTRLIELYTAGDENAIVLYLESLV
jgi:hypothetical protein